MGVAKKRKGEKGRGSLGERRGDQEGVIVVTRKEPGDESGITSMRANAGENGGQSEPRGVEEEEKEGDRGEESGGKEEERKEGEGRGEEDTEWAEGAEGGLWSGEGAGAGSSAFAAAFSSVMRRKLPATAEGPILAARRHMGPEHKRMFADGGHGDVRDAGSDEDEEDDDNGASERPSSAGQGAAPRKERLERRERNHVLPEKFTEPNERALRRIATKGVVRLFNAVSKAQKVQQSDALSGAFVNAAASKELTKKTKAAFLSELRGSLSGPKSGATSSAVSGTNALASGKKGEGNRTVDEGSSNWAVLADDYLTAPAKYKNGIE